MTATIDFCADQMPNEAHSTTVDADPLPPGSASRGPMPSYTVPTLADPHLQMAADMLDDLESLRKANDNRLREMTTQRLDPDGVIRGLGLSEGHPDVQAVMAILKMIKSAESEAVKHLERLMRRHSLGPWVKSVKGMGDKQTARLLAAIGDPYWHVRDDRPRTVSELWAFCGYDVLSNGVAPRRVRGQKTSWSPVARTRAYLVADSIMKSRGTYRSFYDIERERALDAVHKEPCAQCGKTGKPALPGSPLSPGHAHARGIRRIAKEMLKGLWIESKRLHEGHRSDRV